MVNLQPQSREPELSTKNATKANSVSPRADGAKGKNLQEQSVTSPSPKKSQRPHQPESVRFYTRLWALVLVVEFVHQVLNIALALWDPSELQAQAASSIEESGQAISESLLNFGVYGSIVLMGLISVLLLGLLATMLYLLNKQHKRAGLARRMLFFFGLYFTFRLVMIFGSSGNPLSEIPEVFYIIDGNLQVLVGVAAVLTLIFGGRNETLDYTGELERMRQMEQELRAEQERRAQKKKEKQAKKQAEREARNSGKSEDAQKAQKISQDAER
ncbi:hypothetical protein QP940_07980 [Corynebacterium pseudodiphtheriticum]|uniref:hypothetical protein n=1 Tax=Corynebacterium pseudodiphtheriticum TaxID=37637 RepID=UPI00254E5F8E|nr:hypothetical protein [Corynebacterium pseudodiphtheriticum]MDK8614539.1 hypothetical protein [Corynebacterium pseudodiphtheriticum]MDK8685308.1 hypothetical protein [Corynebacterium pseudodiphtheriticum]MDK8738637.1 hypothetical protein [Corynebacterium pseudodiphtheriticum]MDK8745179.1 hypothetical protein [Corynebacterium pseudodiphtheriticum]